MASRLLREFPEASQEAALFVCHLILASKKGHLCVKINANGILPKVDDLWQNEETLPLTLKDSELLNGAILQGAKAIPTQLMTFLESESLEKWPDTPFCCYQNLIYLQRYWVLESIFIKHLKKYLKCSPEIGVENKLLDSSIKELCRQGVLLHEQAQAIVSGCLNGFSIITGGPGTGVQDL